MACRPQGGLTATVPRCRLWHCCPRGSPSLRLCLRPHAPCPAPARSLSQHSWEHVNLRWSVVDAAAVSAALADTALYRMECWPAGRTLRLLLTPRQDSGSTTCVTSSPSLLATPRNMTPPTSSGRTTGLLTHHCPQYRFGWSATTAPPVQSQTTRPVTTPGWSLVPRMSLGAGLRLWLCISLQRHTPRNRPHCSRPLLIKPPHMGCGQRLPSAPVRLATASLGVATLQSAPLGLDALYAPSGAPVTRARLPQNIPNHRPVTRQTPPPANLRALLTRPSAVVPQLSAAGLVVLSWHRHPPSRQPTQ